MRKKGKDPLFYELERISHKDLTVYQKRSKNINEYFRQHFNFFSEKRRIVFEELKDTIRRNTIEYKVMNYQRVASFKYSDTPLSAKGSILNETGGRFNIGLINPNIPKFAALYIAEN